MMPKVVVVMGVSGCGKSSVAALIAGALGYALVEGDALHPPENIARMSAGLPLRDEDRMPWLDSIGAAVREARAAGGGIVVTCSSLRRIYRDRLRAGFGERAAFVWLDGSRELIGSRMTARTGHFMPPALLDSQFATLEPPLGEPDCIRVDIDRSTEEVAAYAVNELSEL
ncbi:gluconokinase [Rhizobiaceae bacterium BDR2-2]|uniref:Gluconokinase n=1 Tax=Ectorhizobium quercum TaxID=2965071 RepID=A0AAE3N2L7_9HYPH|nr:gluconokinase [Ectorhizobium quercum]MCX8996170.1 gluconokinase [Ectorhizobium quercum]MCX8998791.1 gluconokinase [Ectorhizobium quercum]